MDYELLEKMKVEELKNYLKTRALKVTGIKKELVARVIAASENGVQPVKREVEIELDLTLNSGSRVCKSYVFINSYLLSYKN